MISNGLLILLIGIVLFVALFFFFYPSSTVYYTNPTTYVYPDNDYSYSYPYYYDYDSNSRGWWGRRPWRQWGWGWPNYGRPRHGGWYDKSDYQTPGGWRSKFGEPTDSSYNPLRNMVRNTPMVHRATLGGIRPTGISRTPGGAHPGSGFRR